MIVEQVIPIVRRKGLMRQFLECVDDIKKVFGLSFGRVPFGTKVCKSTLLGDELPCDFGSYLRNVCQRKLTESDGTYLGKLPANMCRLDCLEARLECSNADLMLVERVPRILALKEADFSGIPIHDLVFSKLLLSGVAHDIPAEFQARLLALHQLHDLPFATFVH